ncbi:MAG: hypothetical protein WKF73_10060 [Nocardioidaceae bacterium]
MKTDTAHHLEGTASDIKAWLSGRLPADWISEAPDVTVDRDEIVVRLTVTPVELGDDSDETAEAEAAAGRLSAWREETRATRMSIAREAERRFGRKVSWGATVGEHAALFTHIAVPAMTRLRQPQRQVLDTLVEAGVARSRSDALKWCVKLVEQHSEEWLDELRSAMEQVRTVREQGPA